MLRLLDRLLFPLAFSFLALVLIAAPLPAKAADKGAPAAAAVADEPARDPWRSCYVEAGPMGAISTDAAGAATRSAIVVGGVGCTLRFGGPVGHGVVVGAFARGGVDVKSWDKSGAQLAFDVPATVGVRAGVLVTPSVLLYGMSGYTFARANGQNFEGLMLGGGAEAIVTGNMSVAVEYAHDDLSSTVARDSILGVVRFRF